MAAKDHELWLGRSRRQAKSTKALASTDIGKAAKTKRGAERGQTLDVDHDLFRGKTARRGLARRRSES